MVVTSQVHLIFFISRKKGKTFAYMFESDKYRYLFAYSGVLREFCMLPSAYCYYNYFNLKFLHLKD
jgi:hypothetical protein